MSYRSVLRNKGYRTLWFAQIVSALGSRLHAIAFIWLIYEVYGNALTLAFTVAITSIPMAVMALPAGTLVDRMNRKWVMIASDVVRAALVPLIPIFGRDGNLLHVVIGVGVLMSIAGSFFGPARRSIIPNLVGRENIDSANGLAQMTRVGTQSLYAVGGIIVAVVGPYMAFYLDAVTFLLSGIILLWLPSEATIPQRTRDPDASPTLKARAREVVDDARDGLSYIRTHRVLPAMLGLLVVIAFTNAPLGIIMPVFTLQVLDGGSFIFGVVLSSYYVGMFIGGTGIGYAMRSSLSHGQIITWGTVLSGSALALMGIVPPMVAIPLVAALLFNGLCGFFGIYAQIAGETILQTSAPDEVRGKVLSVISGTMALTPPISIVIVGAIMDRFGVVTVLYSIGTMIAIAGVLTLFTPIYGAEPGTGAPPSSAD